MPQSDLEGQVSTARSHSSYEKLPRKPAVIAHTVLWNRMARLMVVFLMRAGHISECMVIQRGINQPWEHHVFSVAWKSLHCHTQNVLNFPNIVPLVMSIVFSVLGQCGGCPYKLAGGVCTFLFQVNLCIMIGLSLNSCFWFLFALFWSWSDQKPLHMAASWFEK